MTQSDYPTLKNAPLKEAIISVAIPDIDEDDLDILEQISEELKEKFPNKKNWELNQATMHFEENVVNTSHKKMKNGFILSSNDEATIVHVGKNNLTINQLYPYACWQDLLDLYKGIWSKYESKIKPQEIISVSLRYINEFQVEERKRPELLKIGFSIETETEIDTSSIEMERYSSRFQLSSNRYSANSMVILDMLSRKEGAVDVVLDIDVISKNKIDNYRGFYAIEDILKNLRSFKNQIFFANIPKAEEMFDGG